MRTGRYLLRCILYLATLGIVSFWGGRLIPAGSFRADSFPFRSFAFEREGQFYDRLKIRRWKDKVPDMSKILPKVMVPKRLCLGMEQERVSLLIQETCIAELVHVLLCIAGCGCLLLWPGSGGVVVMALYILLGNLPFILIQRYNRPRLLRLMKNMSAHAELQEEEAVCVS